MKRPSKRLQTILAVALLLYACGYLTQFIGNYAVWQKNGGMLGGTSPPFPSLSPLAVSSTSKALSTLRVSDYTPQYRESSGVGKRPVLTPDEVLRLPVDEALVILRGHKVLKVHKMDYSLHPAYKQLRECKASAHIPEWRKALPETLETPSVETKASPKALPKRRGRPAKSKTVVATDKESIITKPENEKEIPHGNEQ